VPEAGCLKPKAELPIALKRWLRQPYFELKCIPAAIIQGN